MSSSDQFIVRYGCSLTGASGGVYWLPCVELLKGVSMLCFAALGFEKV